MKLSYFDNFAFAGVTKNGVFAVNPVEKDAKLLFSIFTKPERDMSLNGNLLSWPGEYEFGNIALQIFALANTSLAVKLLVEEVRVLFLPAGIQEFSEQEREIIGNVDVLILEVQEAQVALKKLIEEIDPKVVIPVGPQAEKFLLEMGAGNAQSVEEFQCDAGSLPADQTVFVKLLAV